MQKSIQKKIIVLKTEDSQYFEEAHLILREERCDRSDMVAEACRIISRAEATRIYLPSGRHHRSPSRMAWFFMGAATALVTGSVGALIAHLLF